MSSREKRRKRKREPSPTPPPTPPSKPTPTQSSPIPSLPYDVVLICVARVSRLYYPTLSLVSKSFRSLVSSPELYNTRSLLGFTEICLYVCLKTLHADATWFTLCRKPDNKVTGSSEPKARLKTTGSTSYALARVPTVPTSPCPPGRFRSLEAVGSNIYNIAWPRSLNAFPRFWILDCKSHTWTEAPVLRVELHSFSASVVDRKIYVAGIDYSSKKNSFAVFDTETLIWDSVSSEEREERFREATVSIDGKFHVVTNKEVLAYDPKQGKWEMVGGHRMMGRCMISNTYCVIGNVLYSAPNGVFSWYDTEGRRWRKIQGLVGLPKIAGDDRGIIRLGDYGGKMVVFWGHVSPYSLCYNSCWSCEYTKIWCAEIALERRCQGNTIPEIWGNVEWFDQLLEIEGGYQVEKVVSTTL